MNYKLQENNAGEYRDMAGVAGSKALQLAGIRKAPIAELERCQTAEDVSKLATEYEELVSADLTGYKLHERAWWVCRTMWDKAQPENYDELRSLVWLWEDVCKALVGAEALNIEAYKTSEEGELESCDYEQADTVELRAERVSLRGLHPYDLAGNMAHWCEKVLGERYDYESDGDIEWYTFKK